MLTILQANYLTFFYWVLITSAKASLFIILLIGIKFVLRHKIGARFQYQLWSVLIIGLVLPWSPNSSASVYNYINSSQLLHSITSIFDRTTQPAFTYDENRQFDLVQTDVINSNFNNAVMSTKTQMPSDDTPFVYKVMCFIWFLGVFILTAITVIINKRFSNRIEHVVVTEHRLLSEFNKIKAELKTTAKISLLASERVKSPALLGLIHPRLLLPIGIEQIFSLEQINYIFLHELIHFKRKDLWINWLTQILIICHWFNPLIWYAFYRMREEQEISCDALVTSRINAEQSSNYAYTLVKLAETYSTAPRISNLASLCGSNSQIKKRLITLSNRKHQPASAQWSLVGGSMIALIAFATFASAQVNTNPVLEDGQKIKISQGNNGGQAVGAAEGIVDTSSGIMVEDITGPNYKGKVMLIKDPNRVKLAVTKEVGVTGEKVSELVKDMGAIAGINAGGFYDPEGEGNGAFPDGLTVQEGKLVYNNVGEQEVNIVGFDDQGKMVLGNITAKQLERQHIRDAVTFVPNLIVAGKSVVSGDGGWGIAPRTGIGQMADGTIIFVVIDGRQPSWSIGATLSDLAKVFEDYHAVNAVNLDGGSSSEICYQGKVLNKLPNVFGERYVPTAFVVKP